MGRVARAHRVKMAEGDKESDSEVVQEVAESDMSGVEADTEAGDNPMNAGMSDSSEYMCNVWFLARRSPF